MKSIAKLALIFALTSISFGGEEKVGSTVALKEIIFVRDERAVRVSFAVFSEKDHALRIISNAGPNDVPKYVSLEKAMESAGCVAGCNGGFFNRVPFEPVGFLLADGQRAGKFDPKSWMAGLVVIRRDRITLEPASAYTAPPADAIGILQSGCWLVQDGRSETALDAQRLAQRTFIGHDGEGQWAIGASEPCTLQELANALRSERFTAILDTKFALNLDGGPSTGLWLKHADGTKTYWREQWAVRDFVGVVRK
jgi:hypothetical protein